VTREERNRIQRDTVGQFGNFAYEQERQNRLTASLFGKIIRRRAYTPAIMTLKPYCMAPIFTVRVHTLYFGKINEKVALKTFSLEHKLSVQPSGLFVDLDYGFLRASPDGLYLHNS
jgi:hypothetical protein